MVKILVFTDVHIHPWKYDGANTSAQWRFAVMSVLEKLKGLIERERPNVVVFNGDLVQSKEKHDGRVWPLATRFLFEIAKSAFTVHASFIVNTGNHDIIGPSRTIYDDLVVSGGYPFKVIKNASHAIRLSELVTRKENLSRNMESAELLFIPYGKDVVYEAHQELDYYIAFTHADISGMDLRAGLVSNQDMLPAKVFEPTKWGRKLLVNGHYHSPRFYKGTSKRVPILQVGATHSHHWGDSYDTNQHKRGAVIIETTELSHEMPKIRRITWPSHRRFYSLKKGATKFPKHFRPGRDLVRAMEPVPIGAPEESDKNAVRNAEIAGSNPRKILVGYMKADSATMKLSKKRKAQRYNVGRNLFVNDGGKKNHGNGK